MDIQDVVYNIYSFCYDEDRLNEINTTFYKVQE